MLKQEAVRTDMGRKESKIARWTHQLRKAEVRAGQNMERKQVTK